MLKYELKKYILKPSLLICIIVLVLLNFVKVFELYYYTGGGRAVLSGNAVQGTDILYDKYSGKITDEKINGLKTELANAEQMLKEYGIIEEPIEGTYCGYPYGDVNLFKDLISSYEYAILYSNKSAEITENARANAEFYSDKSRYEYRLSKLYEDCYKGRSLDGYYQSEGHKAIFDYKFSALLSMFIIVLAISPIVSKEYVIGYNKLISSSGKRGSVMLAKLTAAAIFTFAVTLILFVSDMVYFQLIYGFDGFSAPIYALQEFEMSPFNITLFGALVITFVLRLVFLLMFTFLVTAVSSFCKNDIISMVVSVTAGFLLVIGSELLPGVLNPTTLIGPTELFTNMNVCNILDLPVFNVVVTLSEVILLAVVFAVVSVRRGMKCC